MEKVTLNQEVTVTGFYFRNKNLQTFPKQIEYGDRRVTFIEAGLQFLVKTGQHIYRLFDASDGESTYRLKYDTEGSAWTLVHITRPQLASR